MGADVAETTPRAGMPVGGCYRVQVLVVGREKRWRDAVAAHVRNAGFQATACDRGADAMGVLALGLPVDVMVIDVALQGSLCCAQLSVEARALRPGLRFVLAGDSFEAEPEAEPSPDAVRVRREHLRRGRVAGTVREVLAHRFA